MRYSSPVELPDDERAGLIRNWNPRSLMWWLARSPVRPEALMEAVRVKGPAADYHSDQGLSQ